MRISNPRTLVGDLSLATRDYVNIISSNLNTNFNNNISGLTDVVNNIENNDEYLSGAILALKEDLKNGYAYLTSGKIDPSLLPPISIVSVTTINQFDLISDVQTFWDDNHYGNEINIDRIFNYSGLRYP